METQTIGQYLIRRLHELGARHVFGIPGDYVLSFFKLLEESPLQLVGNTNELAAGYAADAYARVKGIGVACVTYGVGGLSLANAVACAYAEKSPVVVISGAPGTEEHKPNLLLHHTIGKERHEVLAENLKPNVWAEAVVELCPASKLRRAALVDELIFSVVGTFVRLPPGVWSPRSRMMATNRPRAVIAVAYEEAAREFCREDHDVAAKIAAAPAREP